MSVLQRTISSPQNPQRIAAAVTSSPEVVNFGPFEVNLRNRELRNHGLRVKLQEKPFQILEALLERPGELVRRSELEKKLWPDTFVVYGRCLNTALSSLRQALGDSAGNPRFIETRHKLGYRFVAPLEAGVPSLTLRRNDKRKVPSSDSSLEGQNFCEHCLLSVFLYAAAEQLFTGRSHWAGMDLGHSSLHLRSLKKSSSLGGSRRREPTGREGRT